jgi:hypothetical protein
LEGLLCGRWISTSRTSTHVAKVGWMPSSVRTGSGDETGRGYNSIFAYNTRFMSVFLQRFRSG